MLPKKRGQTPDERAREIEGALDWMRKKGVDSSDEPVPTFKMLPSVAIARRTPEEGA